ncbi:acyl-CoA thioesterase [Gulosibacter faecalis]|jgi:acyl-CoA thioester hydrolase|uniref:Acyl-CoA thioesterase n=1 Tax=Gulosibacter faecalis TaxID=272240 RepID=A0ABW5UY89_9MICO|nr:thioesterase family protein [Gulosibacter faecalis]
MSTLYDCWSTGDADGERRFHVPIQVRWRDLDGYGHVNNATMFTLLEEARVQAFWVVPEGSDEQPRPLAVVSAGVGADTATLIAAQQIEYRAPIPHLHYPVDVQLWISKIGAASAEVSYEVWSPVTDESRTLFTVARSTIVFIDTTTGRPRRISDAEREAWQPYVGAPAPMRSEAKPAE